jgi:hypothetical protein
MRELWLCEVEVPLEFFGTGGFSARVDLLYVFQLVGREFTSVYDTRVASTSRKHESSRSKAIPKLTQNTLSYQPNLRRVSSIDLAVIVLHPFVRPPYIEANIPFMKPCLELLNSYPLLKTGPTHRYTPELTKYEQLY